MRDTFQIGISHHFLPRIASFQSISHFFWGYLSFHFFALCVSSCRMHLASWLLFTCCLYIMLLISMAFDAFIRVLFYRHLHHSTRVNRSLYPCKQVCAPRWTCLFTWVERWRTPFENATIIVVKQVIIGLFAYYWTVKEMCLKGFSGKGKYIGMQLSGGYRKAEWDILFSWVWIKLIPPTGMF